MKTPKRVPSYKFQQLMNGRSAMEISEEKPVRDTVYIENKCYVATGSVTGPGCGTGIVFAYEAVPLQNYDGKIPAATYRERMRQVNDGARERGRAGTIVRFAGESLVLTGEEHRFVEADSGKQLELL